MKILAAGPLRTGLNNQRLCLLGLFNIAREQGAAVHLPDTVFDFTPREGKRGHPAIGLWDIYDRDAFLTVVQTETLSPGEPDETVPMQACFMATRISSAAPDNFVGRFVLGTPGAAPLRETAGRISSWLADRGAMTVSLRIERDWANYVRKTGDRQPPQIVSALDPAWIFARIRAAAELDRFCALWACCDEDDLMQPKAELKAAAAKFDLELLFKSDLPAGMELPAQSTKRAMIDYTIARNAPVYVGLYGSTFSRMLAITNRLEGHPRRIFFYDYAEGLADPDGPDDRKELNNRTWGFRPR